MNKILVLFCCLLLLVGCTDDTSNGKHRGKPAAGNKKPSPDVTRKVQFGKFVKKFRQLSLPLTIKTLDIEPNQAYHKITDKDTLFINSGYPDETWAYGILPDTSENFQLIWLAPAEMYMPVLTVFTKDGKKISEKHLSVGGCGSDCGFTCEEYIYIREDRSIYAVDSIKRSPCEGSGPKKGMTKKYIRYMTGSIGQDGKISMTGVQEKKLH